MTTGLTAPLPEPAYEPRESVSPEEYLKAAVKDDNHIPRAGVIPFVFQMMSASADIASIYERMVRKGGPFPHTKPVKDRVLRDLGGVLRPLVLMAHFYGFTLRDVIDADYARIEPDVREGQEPSGSNEEVGRSDSSGSGRGQSTGSDGPS